MRAVIALLVLATMGIAADRASAQEGALSRLYGNGIHAYFDGDLSGAEKLFTQAINAGSQDPRCHYYRGLIYLQSGRKQAASAEFETGADLEVGATRAYDVSLALERVQGRARLALEQHRAAKLAIGTSAVQTQRRARIEVIQRREPVTTIKPTPNTLDAITGDAAPMPATLPEVAAPFADPMDAAPPVVTPASKAANTTPPPADAEADPFGTDDALPADAETPAADEPADEEMPAKETPAATEPAADDPASDEADDPFGADDAAPAKEDEAPASTPPAKDDAAPADDAAADAEDPFGGDEAPAAEDDAAPAEDPPADDAAPAKDAEEDPFGS